MHVAKFLHTSWMKVCKKLFDTIAPKYANRQGIYTRVIKTGLRKGDAAPLALSS